MAERHGMGSPEYFEADRATTATVLRIQEILETPHQHWMDT
jgi:hypothetical protein